MTKSQILFGSLFAGFGALSAWAFSHLSWDALAAIAQGPLTIQMTFDLLLAWVVGLTLMWSDAKARDINPLPYLVMTLTTGSFGLLAYAFVRAGRALPSRQKALAA